MLPYRHVVITRKAQFDFKHKNRRDVARGLGLDASVSRPS